MFHGLLCAFLVAIPFYAELPSGRVVFVEGAIPNDFIHGIFVGMSCVAAGEPHSHCPRFLALHLVPAFNNSTVWGQFHLVHVEALALDISADHDALSIGADSFDFIRDVGPRA